MSEKVVSDYNGYDYKKDFWENTGREYEDQADRMAIRKLLPKRMEKFADIGGGYGRLANEYLKRAHKVIIFDYSKTELEQAKEIYGDKIETRAGDIYKLPFKDDELDGLMMIRVTHHLKDMDKALAELYRVLKPNGIACVKCQKTITGSKSLNSPEYLWFLGECIGLDMIDSFMLLAKARLISGKVKNQMHSRRFESEFLVFKKNLSKKITYFDFLDEEGMDNLLKGFKENNISKKRKKELGLCQK